MADTDAAKYLFGDHLLGLVRFLPIQKNTEIVFVNSFWNKDIVNRQILDLCTREGFRYVHISDLGDTGQFKALGKFQNPEVAAHPSDFGMEQIANRILQVLGL